MLYIGEIAAIITSMTFAINSALFTMAGRVVGSMIVNRLRLITASIFLSLAHWIFLGSPWPVEADLKRWFWFGLSGIIGLVVGDAFLFQAFIWVGPRISMLMMSLAPILAAIIAWLFLGEILSSGQLLGILITLLGVIWVIIDKNKGQESGKGNYSKGVLYGFGGAVGQALGFVLAKNGLGDNFSPISGNFIRMFSAMVVLWIATLISKNVVPTLMKALNNPSAAWKIIAGAFMGPFFGVSLSLFALQHTSVGVASTLIALPPIFLIPIEYFYFKERIGWGAIAGTCLAVIGVGILFLV
jgi:drug/metabolite transporter (DMT)-like permease